MDPGGCSSGGGPCYYSVLGIGRNAPASEIRAAYRKLAMKWHPDRWTRDPAAAADANKRFQRIQEAYSVLSDDGKRAMYDVGLYDPLEEDEGFSDFMQEMLSMMDNVKSEKQESFEDLQRMFADLVNGDGMDFGSNGFHGSTRREPSDDTRKRSKASKRSGSNVSGSAVRC